MQVMQILLIKLKSGCLIADRQVKKSLGFTHHSSKTLAFGSQESAMSSPIQTTEALHSGPLSIAVVSPDGPKRNAAAISLSRWGNAQVREFTEYPENLADIPHPLHQGFDAILIDLDGNTELALGIVETLCASRSAIVMVFSAESDPNLMLRSMRAGAREFLSVPFDHAIIAKALSRVGSRRQQPVTAIKRDAKLLVFFGAKGGVGVTTLATNMAVALAEETQQSTLLIDLNLQLGDAAMNLGIEGTFSTVDALQNSAQLDPALLVKFLVRHTSGLSVLPAPLELDSTRISESAIGSLLAVARKQFHYVVVDAGKKIDLRQLNLFEELSTAYLVTQAGIPELRNANRLITQFSTDHCPTLEIVVNRYQSRFLGITDEHLAKALTRPVRWKVPNDYKTVRQMQSSATPLVDHESPLAVAIREMARSASGISDLPASESRRGSAGSLRFPWKKQGDSLAMQKV
jgi:pilus assembly protein CpaE